MAFSELEIQRIKKIVGGFCQSISPKHIYDELHYDYDLKGHVLTLVEVRPDWRDPHTINRHGFARIRWVKTAGEWRLYWLRQTLKWQLYEPFPEARHLDEIIAVIKQDQYACFFG